MPRSGAAKTENRGVPSSSRAQRDETALIRRVQQGETGLFYELIEPYQRSVYYAAYAVLENDADAEEAAQEAFLKALTHLP